MPKLHPNAGKRLLPHAVDELARDYATHIVYEIPIEGNVPLSYRKVSALEYARAIDRAAWWFQKNLGCAPQGEFPTVGYIGPGQ
jgi:hypothetical protein